MTTASSLPDPGAAVGIGLRPIEPGDYAPLRRFELDLGRLGRWRQRGTTPSPESFAQSLWSGVLAQFLVTAPDRPEPIGLVSAYGADLQSGTAWIAFARLPGDAPQGWFLLGARRFVDLIFDTWPLRKLYAEVLAPNLAQFASATSRLFVQEGRFAEHAYVEGRYVDQYVLALTRDRWAQRASAQPHRDQGLVSLERFVHEVAAALERVPAELDADLPMTDLGLDSLDWLVVCDLLDQVAGEGTDVVEALGAGVTLRAVHGWLVEQAALAPLGG